MSKLAHSNQETMDEIEARAAVHDYAAMDAEANAFAMELLMPEELVRKHCAGIDIMDAKAMDRAARLFRVDTHVLAVRMGHVFGLGAS